MRHGKAVRDDRTLELFDVPKPKLAVPGEGNYGAEVSLMVAALLKGQDRNQLAADMSRLSGDDVSKNMLDAWSSPARDGHNLPFYRVPLLEEVCQSHMLTDWLVALRGGRASYGRDALLAELGRQERNRDESARRAREIKRLLGVAPHA